jgi:hypothetical protein
MLLLQQQGWVQAYWHYQYHLHADRAAWRPSRHAARQLLTVLLLLLLLQPQWMQAC